MSKCPRLNERRLQKIGKLEIHQILLSTILIATIFELSILCLFTSTVSGFNEVSPRTDVLKKYASHPY